MVIQAGFANGYHARVIQLVQQPVQRRRSTWLHIQRVDTYRAIDIGIAIRQGFDITGVIGTHADAQEMTDPALAGGFKGCIQRAVVGAQIKAIEVAWPRMSSSGESDEAAHVHDMPMPLWSSADRGGFCPAPRP